MVKTNKDLITEFCEDVQFLVEYNKSDNVAKKSFDAKISQKVGKRVDKCVTKIVQTANGIDQLSTLLNNEDNVLSYSTAQYLYPIYPQRCLKIFENYKATLKSEVDKFSVEMLIQGYTKDNSPFDRVWRSIYGDNWRELNREVEKENG